MSVVEQDSEGSFEAWTCHQSMAFLDFYSLFLVQFDMCSFYFMQFWAPKKPNFNLTFFKCGGDRESKRRFVVIANLPNLFEEIEDTVGVARDVRAARMRKRVGAEAKKVKIYIFLNILFPHDAKLAPHH